MTEKVNLSQEKSIQIKLINFLWNNPKVSIELRNEVLTDLQEISKKLKEVGL